MTDPAQPACISADTVADVIDVIGVPAEGLSGLPEVLQERVRAAPVLLGSPRLLALVPDRRDQHRQPWRPPMLTHLPEMLTDLPRDAVVLASGDPLVHGVGATIVRLLGTDAVRLHPAVSSIALARARMGWSLSETVNVSLLTRPVTVLRRHLTPGARILVLSATEHTPGEIATFLDEMGCGTAKLTILGDLGSDAESRWETTVTELLARRGDAVREQRLPRLNIVAIDVPEVAGLNGVAPGLPDDVFEHDGQLTKQEHRALAISALRPMPGQRLLDLGAGAGSVAIEWCLGAERATAIAIEQDPVRADRVRINARAHGVEVEVHRQRNDEALATDLSSPDAVFIGGGASKAIIEAAWNMLPIGGRLVAHAVTISTETLLHEACNRFGGQIKRVLIERAAPLGSSRAWTPARPIVQWSAVKSP